MKIEVENSSWGGNRFSLGPFLDRQDWNLWHHFFIIGFGIGPWDFGIKVTLWDIEETMERLKGKGMTEDEAWEFCQKVREEQPDPYHISNMKGKIEERINIS